MWLGGEFWLSGYSFMISSLSPLLPSLHTTQPQEKDIVVFFCEHIIIIIIIILNKLHQLSVLHSWVLFPMAPNGLFSTM